MVNSYKGVTGWRCKVCTKQFHFKETADLCCTKKGCGFVESPKAIITNVCGETVQDGRF